MSYQIELSPAAKRQFKKLPINDKIRVGRVVNSLKDEPRPQGCKKLTNTDNLYRVRAGEFRVIYTIEDDIILITIVRIRKRNEVYLNLNRL